MTMITPSYLGETIEYSSLHACRSTLEDPTGKNPGTYLIEDLAISSVISGRHAAEVFSANGQQDGGGLLAIGGINYGADLKTDSGTALASNRLALLDDQTRSGFVNLPGTEAEARQIHTTFRRTFPGGRSVILTGDEPDRRRIKQELSPIERSSRWRYLHLASHGFFAPPTAISALRKEVPASAAHRLVLPVEQEAHAFGLDPMLLSGLVLAGSNQSGNRQSKELEGGNGILTAEEVAGFDLRGTELVVLSACDTGLGNVAGGEGVLGLQRAFQVAGARTLVTSLWKVDDETTQELMERFYENLWQKGLGSHEALRQAQLSILNGQALRTGQVRGPGPVEPAPNEERRASAHPRLWAAWVMSGDPGALPTRRVTPPPDAEASRSSVWLLALAAFGVGLVLVSFWLVWWFRRRGAN